jgi:hypothetical protein
LTGCTAHPVIVALQQRDTPLAGKFLNTGAGFLLGLAIEVLVNCAAIRQQHPGQTSHHKQSGKTWPNLKLKHS